MKIFTWIACVAGILIGIFLLGSMYMGGYEYFAKQKEEIDHSIYKEGTNYKESMAKDISAYYLKYMSATDEEKSAYQAVIQHTYANFNANNIANQQIREWFKKVRGF